MLQTALKPHQCAHCKRVFMPARAMQAVCGPSCAYRKVRAAAAEKKTAERAMDKSRREALKTIADRIATAQTEFNGYIRLRDMHRGCIDCGKPFEPQKPGGSIDAGHYRSRGAAPQLRFSEDNCFAQRKNCNRPGGATSGDFRAGMVARIGEERVLEVERANFTHKWTREELIDIAAGYREKRKALEAGRKGVQA